MPALKFDHPVSDNSDTLARYPIQPTPDLLNADQKQYSATPNQKYVNHQRNQYPAGPVAEDGFIPLFLPDKFDPMQEKKFEQTTQKLPPEGYQLPFYLPGGQTLSNNYQTSSSQYPLVYR